MEEVAIRVEHVSKNFRLPHEKTSSIKNIFVHLYGYIRKRRIYETQRALHDVSFEIKKGEFFGIVGRNGSGKSTLLKMLAGIYQPTKGKIEVAGKLVPFIELGVGFSPELTGRENVYLNGALLGFSKQEIDTQYDDIVKFAELEKFMDQKLKNYSSGMQVRLAFSMAVRAKADILLIDEVLAVGDADFQRKCFEYFKTLKKNKSTVVFVSHDMGAIKEFCDKAALIESNQLQSIGSPNKIADEYSQLFLGQEDDTVTDGGKRWGNRDVSITKASTTVDKDNITVNIDLKVNKNTEKVIYGIHVISQDGAEITAMNNRMVNLPDLSNLTKGEAVNLQWKIANVFNDGKYTINLTFIDDVSNALDWQISATGFTIKRLERSTTAILPPVQADFRVKS